MIKKILLGFLLLGLLTFLVDSSIIAQTSDCQDKKDQEKITCLQNKINELQGQKRTLSSQIAVMDNQVRLTEFRISATKQQISELALDINTATKKIDNLEKALDNLTKVLINRIVATYQVGRTQPFEILLSSSDASSFFSRLNYLRIAQAHDKQIIYQTQQAKNDYTNQKDIFEAKKKKVEALKISLERFEAQLEQEKKNKQAFLEITKNDEANYQKLLSQALAESKAITAAFSEAVRRLSSGEGENVSQDSTIAQIGNSGWPDCSTGAHLHFTVLKNGSHQNPSSYLSSTSFSYSYGEGDYIKYGTISPSGPWPWPIDQPIIINQAYGSSHLYAQNYSPPVHDGIDMQSGSSPADGRPIKAPKSGKMIRGSTTCDSAYVSGVSILKYTAIKHDDDPSVITLYLHIQ